MGRLLIIPGPRKLLRDSALALARALDGARVMQVAKLRDLTDW